MFWGGGQPLPKHRPRGSRSSILENLRLQSEGYELRPSLRPRLSPYPVPRHERVPSKPCLKELKGFKSVQKHASQLGRGVMGHISKKVCLLPQKFPEAIFFLIFYLKKIFRKNLLPSLPITASFASRLALNCTSLGDRAQCPQVGLARWTKGWARG